MYSVWIKSDLKEWDGLQWNVDPRDSLFLSVLRGTMLKGQYLVKSTRAVETIDIFGYSAGMDIICCGFA